MKTTAMGYMGFGMQNWITKMKPKPYFGRKDRPGSEHHQNYAGHDIQDLYHLKKNRLDNLNQKKPTLKYMRILRNQIKTEKRKQLILGLVELVISLFALVVIIIYLNNRFDLF